MGENIQENPSVFSHGAEVYKRISEASWPVLKKGPGRTIFLVVLFFIAACVSARWINSSITDGSTLRALLVSKSPPKPSEILLNCTTVNLTKTCPARVPVTSETSNSSSSSTGACPNYFRWIHEDLRPWKKTGITKEMVERGRKTANFRLVIVNGTVYVEKYSGAFQTRDVFTWWGILQLMKRYPGRLPDLDLMFDCDDRPVVRASDYQGQKAVAPPPLFHYCADDSTLDIVFPDWSFWGWPEINIKPWEPLMKELKEGNKKKKWIKREPYAFWKGNPYTSPTRGELMKCNPSHKQDWNVRAYAVDWGRASKQGYTHSNLADQCTHRYKIYVEGRGWSVSEKYILACNSVTLLVKTQYYDFFTRSLQPMQHYWPIKDRNLCRSIKFAVDWGNNHKKKAQAIGKTGSNLMLEGLKMDYVYDYMFHLLNEYAKLLKYKPTVPEKAIEFCSEAMACPANGLVKKFMMESMVEASADTSPCTMPPPFDPPALQAFLDKKANVTKQVETWEKNFWENQNKKH